MAVDLTKPILVVDDHVTMLRIIRNFLRYMSFTNIHEASDGAQALAKLRSGPEFGLIVSDWTMEPMTGIELLRKVRADENLKHITFVMVTAESKTENVIVAKKAGVSNYAVKPFNAETLKGRLTNVLGEF